MDILDYMQIEDIKARKVIQKHIDSILVGLDYCRVQQLTNIIAVILDYANDRF